VGSDYEVDVVVFGYVEHFVSDFFVDFVFVGVFSVFAVLFAFSV